MDTTEPQKLNPAGQGGAALNSHFDNAPSQPVRQDAEKPLFTKIKAVRFRVRYGDGTMVERTIMGRQTARTLAALVHREAVGVTALEMSGWALRLSAYVHVLRHRHGLDIVTLSEAHDGGEHGRYVLQTPVEILDIVTA